MLPILHQSYWRDEAWSVLLSQKSLFDIFLLTIKDVHPPLYFFILHFWMRLFGDFEYSTRSLSLLFHFLLVTASFFLILHLVKSWKPALLGAGAVLLNPFLLHYAFETRPYPLFSFLTIVSVFFFLKKKYITASILLSLMLLTHNFALLFFAAFVIYWIAIGLKSYEQRFKDSIKLLLLPTVTFLFWLSFLWNQWVMVAKGFWLENKTSTIFVEAFRNYFMGLVEYPSRGMLYNLTLLLVFFALSYWVIELSKKAVKTLVRENKEIVLILFLIFFPFLTTYLVSWLWIPVYHDRFLTPVLPLVIVFIIYSLSRLANLNATFVAVMLSFSIAYLLFGMQASEEIVRRPTKKAINYGVKQIISQARRGDIIVPNEPVNFLETKYYVNKVTDQIPVYVLYESGDIPFYIGGKILIDDHEILRELPLNRRIWMINSDGSYTLKE